MIPISDIDPWSDENLTNPFDDYAALREAGPVVRLKKYELVALTRYDDVRAALRDWRTFRSSEGISFNDTMNNEVLQRSVLTLEPPDHDLARSAMTKQYRLSEIRNHGPIAQRRADDLVEKIAAKKEFDAVKDLAEPYVLGVMGELLGVPDSYLSQLLAGSHAGFTTIGPPNRRMTEALPVLEALLKALQGLTKKDMRPGSIAWHALEAVERGEIPDAVRTQVIFNFASPAFDTTVNAIGSIIWLLATNPDQWDRVTSDPSLTKAAINEGIRVESPIQIWGRYCSEKSSVDGVTIPADTRIAIMIGAANRDGTHYPNPNVFDIHRNPTDHLAFGNGIHLCVGAPLARLEIDSVLTALAKTVSSIKLTRSPTRRLNNSTRGFERLPVSID